ncbi:unnamed protein product [Hymenolepis diminuta]|uniref:Ion_trans domain-containing protein n=1 Tax=Hymenolepis diminuta TaxID=6216 RepID=A0A0R3SIR8_HYMDI|nr:unnamed protein product [Hymenolepis diminuta]
MIGLTGDEVSEPRTAVLYAFLLAFMIFLEIALNRCGLNSYTLTLQCDPTVSNNAKIYLYCIGVLRGGSVKPSPSCMDHVLKNVLFPLMSMFLDLPIVSGVARRTIANMMAAVKVNATTTPGDKG